MDKEAVLKTIGANIKKRREEIGMSLEELANACGYTKDNARSSMSKIENGKTDIPASKMRLIANVLNIPPTDLMGCDNDETYYLNPETAKAAQEVFENPELKILFDAARDAKPEDIKLAAEMLKRMKETNPDG